MRDRKKNITIDVDSALSVMQEIYNDIAEQKNIASLIAKKMLVFMKEAEDMSVIGPVIKEQQKILNDCIEKKLSLVKIQSALLKVNTTGDKNGAATYGKMELSAEDRKLLEDMINDKEDKKKPEDDSEKYTT